MGKILSKLLLLDTAPELAPEDLDYYHKVFGVSKSHVKSMYKEWMKDTEGKMTAKDLVDVLQYAVPSGEKHAAENVANLVLRLLDYLTASMHIGHQKAEPEEITFQDWMVLNTFLEEKGGNKQTLAADALYWCAHFKGHRRAHPELSRQVKEDHDSMFGSVLFEEQEERARAQVEEDQEKEEAAAKRARKKKKNDRMFHEPEHEDENPSPGSSSSSSDESDSEDETAPLVDPHRGDGRRHHSSHGPKDKGISADEMCTVWTSVFLCAFGRMREKKNKGNIDEATPSSVEQLRVQAETETMALWAQCGHYLEGVLGQRHGMAGAGAAEGSSRDPLYLSNEEFVQGYITWKRDGGVDRLEETAESVMYEGEEE